MRLAICEYSQSASSVSQNRTTCERKRDPCGSPPSIRVASVALSGQAARVPRSPAILGRRLRRRAANGLGAHACYLHGTTREPPSGERLIHSLLCKRPSAYARRQTSITRQIEYRSGSDRVARTGCRHGRHRHGHSPTALGAGWPLSACTDVDPCTWLQTVHQILGFAMRTSKV